MRFQCLALCSCILVVSCSSGYRNEIGRVTLSPGQHKVYGFDTQDPMRIGILLAQDVSGGLVELQQVGSASKGGTAHYYMSRQWQPIDGRIELKLVNNSKTEVEVVIFKGSKPER